MLNERKLTERELDKREEAIKGLLSNKRKLVKKYGKDAEKVMYGIATKQAKKKVENMNLDSLKELIKKSLQKEAGTSTIDTGFSGRADYGEEDRALGREDELEMRGLEEGHGLGQKDLDTLESLRNQIEQGTLDSKKQDEFIKVLDFLIKSNILQDKTKDLSKGKVDENLIKEFIGGETEKRITVLFDKLVPGSGNADTVEGEIIRAINRIIYRWGNDGDLFWSGYGAETAGPAMEYLTDASDIPFEIREKFKAWENDNFGKDYDKGELIDLAQIALQHVEIKVKEDDLTKNEDDLFNYGQKYIDHVRDMEEEEDEYDDYYDDYDDEDDEFMNEGHMMPMDDLDVGHTDNEPHMLKKELARAGQMVQMLYRAVDKYDGQGEVDFPQWWQKKIIQANAMLDSAFDYIDGEEMVAKIDAMIDNMDSVEVDIDVVNEEENIQKRLDAEKAIRQTLKDEGGAAGLEPLVKAVKKFGFNKAELVKLLKKIVKVDKHKHGDYILTPINEKELSKREINSLKKIEKELRKASQSHKSQSKALAKSTKAHKSQADRINKLVKEMLTEMDGGTLFDYFNKKYIVDDHFLSDDSYIVKREPSGKDQYVIFDYDKDKDQFQIRQMGGYRIDRSEAMKAGMRETSSLARAGMDAYMVDGNYSPTPISIKGLKDVVDHVMGGLSREAAAQQDYYARRGPVSGTIDEKIRLAVEKKLTAAEKRKKEDIIMALKKQKGGKKKLEPVDYAVATDRAKKLAEEFKVGQKVTYLGNPGEITKVDKDVMDRVYYNVLYDKGTGKTKATNIYNKDGEIKAV